MKGLIRLFGPLLCLTMATTLALANQNPDTGEQSRVDVRITQTQGLVYVKLHDFSEDEFIRVENDFPLEEGDLIRTGQNGSAEIVVNGDSLIHLDSNSDFKPESLDSKVTRFFLGIGRLTAKVRSLLKEEEIQVRTPICVAAVRGTEFSVAHEADEEPSHVCVFDEGQVIVRALDVEDEVSVAQGQESEIRRGQKPSPPTELRFLAPQRVQLEKIRVREKILHTIWKPLPHLKRVELRRPFVQIPRLKVEALDVRPDLRHRRYKPFDHHRPPKPDLHPPHQKHRDGPRPPKEGSRRGERRSPQKPGPKRH